VFHLDGRLFHKQLRTFAEVPDQRAWHLFVCVGTGEQDLFPIKGYLPNGCVSLRRREGVASNRF
jgi:hypothetical protein